MESTVLEQATSIPWETVIIDGGFILFVLVMLHVLLLDRKK
jgi:hypothetical protein